MGTRPMRCPTCPSRGYSSPRREHRLRFPESLRDVPVSARAPVPLPDRPVLLDLESFSRLKLLRRHVVTRDLESNRHVPEFRVGLMIRNANCEDECEAETVRLVRLRVDMSVDSWFVRKRISRLPLAGSAHRQHALCQLTVTYAACGSRGRWG